MHIEPQARRLLEYWFDDSRETVQAIPARMPFWFEADIARDTQLANRFALLADLAANGDLRHWEHQPQSCLALILALDQLPRNLYRGSAAAFAQDAAALELCVQGHDSGMDLDLTLIERVFFWMPLQHAEDEAMQNLGVRLFDSLADDDPVNAGLWLGFAGYARLHRDIIRRFGRFPHRNRVLGRETTGEERAWLEEGGERFGQ